jgi:hypothetical protein
MARCIMVYERNRTYHRIPDVEIEDWEEILDSIDGKPKLIGPVDGWAPYTHAYRLPEGTVYLVVEKPED